MAPHTRAFNCPPGTLFLVGLAVTILLASAPCIARADNGPPPPPFPIGGDVNGDRRLDFDDILLFRDLWQDYFRNGVYDSRADLDRNGYIQYWDSALLIEAFIKAGLVSGQQTGRSPQPAGTSAAQRRPDRATSRPRAPSAAPKPPSPLVSGPPPNRPLLLSAW